MSTSCAPECVAGLPFATCPLQRIFRKTASLQSLISTSIDFDPWGEIPSLLQFPVSIVLKSIKISGFEGPDNELYHDVLRANEGQLLVELGAWWYIEAVFRMRPHSSAAQAAFTRLAQLYVTLQGRVPQGTRGYHTLRWPAFAGRALAQAMWIYLCFAFPSDQMSRLGWPRAQDIADVAHLWTNGTLGPKVNKRTHTDAGSAAVAIAKSHRKQDFLFPLPIFYLKKDDPDERRRMLSKTLEDSKSLAASGHRRVHPKDLSRRKMHIVLTHSLFVQEVLRRGRGNTEYLRLRESFNDGEQASAEQAFTESAKSSQMTHTSKSIREYYDGDDYVLYDPWLRSGASSTGSASVMPQQLSSTGRPLDELMKQREQIFRQRLKHKQLVLKRRQQHAQAHHHLPQQQLQDAPPYPNLALPLSVSFTHMRDTFKPLDSLRPRDARCEAQSETDPLPPAATAADTFQSIDFTASVSSQVRTAREAESNRSKAVRPWSLPNGSLSIAAVSVLGSESKTIKSPAPHIENKQTRESDGYFFQVANQHLTKLEAALPTSNHEAWDQTRARLQAAVKENRSKHEASMVLLKQRNQRTLDEIKALKAVHNKLKESPHQMRESAFEVMTLRAQSDEEMQKAVQRMKALRP